VYCNRPCLFVCLFVGPPDYSSAQCLRRLRELFYFTCIRQMAATGAKKWKLEGPATLTFDLLTYLWGYWLPVLWASLLPNFSLLCPSVLEIGPDTGQTDR